MNCGKKNCFSLLAFECSWNSLYYWDLGTFDLFFHHLAISLFSLVRIKSPKQKEGYKDIHNSYITKPVKSEFHSLSSVSTRVLQHIHSWLIKQNMYYLQILLLHSSTSLSDHKWIYQTKWEPLSLLVKLPTQRKCIICGYPLFPDKGGKFQFLLDPLRMLHGEIPHRSYSSLLVWVASVLSCTQFSWV